MLRDRESALIAFNSADASRVDAGLCRADSLEGSHDLPEGCKGLVAEIGEVDVEVQILADAHHQFHERERVEDFHFDQIEIFFDRFGGEAVFEQPALEVFQHDRSDLISRELFFRCHGESGFQLRSGPSDRDLENIATKWLDVEVVEAPKCLAEPIDPRLDVCNLDAWKSVILIASTVLVPGNR